MNIRIATVSVALLIAASGSSPDAANTKRIAPIPKESVETFKRGDRVAVVVGVGNYPELSGLTKLEFPAVDAKAMAVALEKQNYLVKTLLDGEATGGSVRAALKQAANVVTGGDSTLLFYFSGHGFSDSTKNYLAVYETFADDLSRTGLSFAEVSTLLDAVPTRKKVVFLDACRNNPTRGAKGASLRAFSDFAHSQGTRILFSTRMGSFSYEDPAVGHGVFTHYLLEGLRGEAAGSDGYVTFRDLSEFVQSSVRRHAFKRNWSQVPYDAGEATGDFLLGQSSGKEPGSPTVSPQLAQIAKDKQAFDFVARNANTPEGWRQFLEENPESSLRSEAMNRWQALIEQRSGSRAALAPPSEEMARAEYGEINKLVSAGNYNQAKTRLSTFMTTYDGTSTARGAQRLNAELSVIGKNAPVNWNIEKWYQGESDLDLVGNGTKLLVFWETWCPHCRREVPKLQKLYSELRSQGLGVVGLTKVTKSSTDEAVRDFVKENSIRYPVAKEDGSLSSFFNVSGIPAAAVVKDGKVVWRGHPARLDKSMLRSWL